MLSKYHVIKALTFIVFTFVLVGCGQSNDHKLASHPALQELHKVKFVPIQDFLHGKTAGNKYEISPEGKWISWESFDANGRYTFAFQPRSGSSTAKTLYSTEPARFFWGNFDRYIYLFASGRLYRFETENLEKPHRDVTPRGLGQWDLGWRPEFKNDRWLVGSRDRNPAFVDLYSVNDDGSEKQLLVRNPGNIIDWSIDHDGNVFWQKLRIAGDRTLHQYAQNSSTTPIEIFWREIFKTEASERLTIISPPLDSETILAFSDRGRDALALVNIDLKDGTESVIAEESQSDVSEIFMSDAKHRVSSLVWFTSGYSQPQALNNWGREFLEFLELLASGNKSIDYVRIISHSKDHRFLIVETSSVFGGTEFHLFDMSLKTRKQVGHSPLTNNEGPLSQSKPMTIWASDGLELPSILTLPTGVEAKKLPLILLIHGGPAKHYLVKPDPQVQFFANRGYAVLQVNYRGSSGFGKTHQEAGFRQFRRDIQRDLIEAARWAIAEDIADPDAIAVVGASFGGYAALMALAQNSDLFAAGISISGPTDIYYQAQNNPFTWQLFGHLWKRYLGDPERETDASIMKELSPITQLSKINAPVLLIHGRRDEVVGVEQTEKLEKKLNSEDRAPEVLYFEDEAHGIVRYKSMIEYYNKIERFLAKNLGGRMSLPDAEKISEKTKK